MAKIRVPIINQSKNSLPSYATEDAAGLDICAHLSSEVSLAPLERQLIPTGIFVEIPRGFEIQVRPRSGMAIRQGITCLNSPGTIDADYRGEIKVILVNLSQEVQTVRPGERIAQLVLNKVRRIAWKTVGTLKATARGEGGFGHTGK